MKLKELKLGRIQTIGKESCNLLMHKKKLKKKNYCLWNLHQSNNLNGKSATVEMMSKVKPSLLRWKKNEAWSKFMFWHSCEKNLWINFVLILGRGCMLCLESCIQWKLVLNIKKKRIYGLSQTTYTKFKNRKTF